MRTIGGILLAAGILIAGLSGLCSLVFVATELTSPYSSVDEIVSYVLGIGGIPFVIGLGLIFFGRRLLNSGKTD
jgi:hypothetical protein